MKKAEIKQNSIQASNYFFIRDNFLYSCKKDKDNIYQLQVKEQLQGFLSCVDLQDKLIKGSNLKLLQVYFKDFTLKNSCIENNLLKFSFENEKVIANFSFGFEAVPDYLSRENLENKQIKDKNYIDPETLSLPKKINVYNYKTIDEKLEIRSKLFNLKSLELEYIHSIDNFKFYIFGYYDFKYNNIIKEYVLSKINHENAFYIFYNNNLYFAGNYEKWDNSRKEQNINKLKEMNKKDIETFLIDKYLIDFNNSMEALPENCEPVKEIESDFRLALYEILQDNFKLFNISINNNEFICELCSKQSNQDYRLCFNVDTKKSYIEKLIYNNDCQKDIRSKLIIESYNIENALLELEKYDCKDKLIKDTEPTPELKQETLKADYSKVFNLVRYNHFVNVNKKVYPIIAVNKPTANKQDLSLQIKPLLMLPAPEKKIDICFNMDGTKEQYFKHLRQQKREKQARFNHAFNKVNTALFGLFNVACLLFVLFNINLSKFDNLLALADKNKKQVVIQEVKPLENIPMEASFENCRALPENANLLLPVLFGITTTQKRRFKSVFKRSILKAILSIIIVLIASIFFAKAAVFKYKEYQQEEKLKIEIKSLKYYKKCELITNPAVYIGS
jgi:hypothetical protein